MITLIKEKENNVEKTNLIETLTSFISEITQMEKDNKKLNEDIRELEKEKAEGYKKFNTDTHILLEKDKLDEILSNLDTLKDESSRADDDCQQAQSHIDDAQYSTRDCYDNAKALKREFQELIREEEKEETNE